VARIAVVTSHPPLSRGGHLVIAEALTAVLRDAGHDAGLILTPQNRFGRQGGAYLANWLTDVGQAHDGRPVDQVISLRFPSYAVRHKVHVCWLNHRMREYYDQWSRFSCSLSRHARLKERVRRRLIHSVDHYLLTRNVTRVFAQSRTIQARLNHWGGIRSTVLHPPPPPRHYRCDEYGDSILVVSRLTPLKRVDLVVDALCEPVAAGVHCVIVGDGDAFSTLRQRVRENGLEERVTFLGDVDESELVGQLARCRAVCFPARQEDYGLVTVEAFASAKAVITCDDSGGPTELVRDGVNGFVTAPNPQSLATTLAMLSEQPDLAERLGQQALRGVSEITWENTVKQLLLV
jgi:glycosyltransferase involved in cell wall biosynthesis